MGSGISNVESTGEDQGEKFFVHIWKISRGSIDRYIASNTRILESPFLYAWNLKWKLSFRRVIWDGLDALSIRVDMVEPIPEKSIMLKAHFQIISKYAEVIEVKGFPWSISNRQVPGHGCEFVMLHDLRDITTEIIWNDVLTVRAFVRLEEINVLDEADCGDVSSKVYP